VIPSGSVSGTGACPVAQQGFSKALTGCEKQVGGALASDPLVLPHQR
jgi:hypothetical protein